jgi:hypothetical protein
LIIFQQLAFSSKANSDSNYWNFSNPGVLGIFNIIEFIWGFQFLRDACKYVFTQSTSVFRDVQLIGTGKTIPLEITNITGTLPSLDFSPDIGAVS